MKDNKSIVLLTPMTTHPDNSYMSMCFMLVVGQIATSFSMVCEAAKLIKKDRERILSNDELLPGVTERKKYVSICL
jgi:hypothetical protein